MFLSSFSHRCRVMGCKFQILVQNWSVKHNIVHTPLYCQAKTFVKRWDNVFAYRLRTRAEQRYEMILSSMPGRVAADDRFSRGKYFPTFAFYFPLPSFFFVSSPSFPHTSTLHHYYWVAHFFFFYQSPTTLVTPSSFVSFVICPSSFVLCLFYFFFSLSNTTAL